MKNKLIVSLIYILIATFVVFAVGCDFQPVEPEVVTATTLDKKPNKQPFPYLQEFHPMNPDMYNWWVSNDTIFVKFINGRTPHATNYFLFVEHTAPSYYTMFYYLHEVQPFTAVPYIGTPDISNIRLYAITIE